MEDTCRTVEGRIIHSQDALSMIVGLANENPLDKVSIKGIVGDLKLELEGEYIHITYTGREDIARRLNEYIDSVNYDGSHEAMMAALKFRVRRRN